MKFYVWPYAQVRFYGGILGVLAESKEAAIAAILEKYNNDKHVAKTVKEDPDIYEVGEVFFWETDN